MPMLASLDVIAKSGFETAFTITGTSTMCDRVPLTPVTETV